jgi:toxin ParE1/3/4
LRRIRWAPAAADDLQAISEYWRGHHPTFAQSTIQKLYDAARSLRKFPHRGRVGEAANTRELLTVPLPYIIVYGIDTEFVHIFRVVHAAESRLQ